MEIEKELRFCTKIYKTKDKTPFGYIDEPMVNTKVCEGYVYNDMFVTSNGECYPLSMTSKTNNSNDINFKEYIENFKDILPIIERDKKRYDEKIKEYKEIEEEPDLKLRLEKMSSIDIYRDNEYDDDFIDQNISLGVLLNICDPYWVFIIEDSNNKKEFTYNKTKDIPWELQLKTVKYFEQKNNKIKIIV